MLLFLAIVTGYSLMAIATKSYYKIYRHTSTISPEDPYFVGIGWPIYLVYRLIAWPYIVGSSYLEKKITDVRENKEKQEKAKVRVSCELPDSAYREAEQEVEAMLSKERSL